ncbi:unnamed protein product [Vicia faba]|uniref:RRM domain-containing protein n=1 Tax=Vicia faba TaxID=3906 RepID=A0AAV0ZXZ8_VICFA|nr:unnamed protein product [Vicia faba]
MQNGSRSKVEGEVAVILVYFSEFPDRCKAREFHKLFGPFGNVVEISIAPRRNKLGKKFGFVRFKDVADAQILAVKLDNVIVDGKKIHANLPRFERKVGTVLGNPLKATRANEV